MLVPQSDSATASWTVAHQAPIFMEFSRQEYWSGQPFLSPGDLPDPGIKPGSPALQADSLLSEPPGKPCGFSKSPLLGRLQSSLWFICWRQTAWIYLAALPLRSCMIFNMLLYILSISFLICKIRAVIVLISQGLC